MCLLLVTSLTGLLVTGVAHKAFENDIDALSQ